MDGTNVPREGYLPHVRVGSLNVIPLKVADQ